jgi:hypothetical protein
VALDLALAPALLVAPLVRHSFVEGRVHQPVELIDIHRVDAVLMPLELGLMAPDRFLVLAAFVGVAGVQCIGTHSSTSSSNVNRRSNSVNCASLRAPPAIGVGARTTPGATSSTPADLDR